MNRTLHHIAISMNQIFPHYNKHEQDFNRRFVFPFDPYCWCKMPFKQKGTPCSCGNNLPFLTAPLNSLAYISNGLRGKHSHISQHIHSWVSNAACHFNRLSHIMPNRRDHVMVTLLPSLQLWLSTVLLNPVAELFTRKQAGCVGKKKHCVQKIQPIP